MVGHQRMWLSVGAMNGALLKLLALAKRGKLSRFAGITIAGELKLLARGGKESSPFPLPITKGYCQLDVLAFGMGLPFLIDAKTKD